jgi:hypothetical protein
MSAYIVEKKTIDLIVSHIYGKRLDNIHAYYPAVFEAYKGDPAKLGQNLWAMNVKAVDQRYQENNPVNLYKYESCVSSPVQIYKSLQCYLYQCAEGKVQESPLYKDMERMKHSLASDIICAMPAYEKAAWS